MDKITKKLKILGDFIGENPIEFAKRKYKKEVSDILQGTMADHIKEALATCREDAFGRTLIQYATELLIGWIIEDYLVDLLESRGYKVELTGGDRERKFNNRKQIQTTADLKIIHRSGKSFSVEVCTDFSGYWTSTQKMDLRFNKLKHIQSQENPFILALDIKNRSFYLIKADESIKAEIYNNPLWGGKPCYQINLSEYKSRAIESI